MLSKLCAALVPLAATLAIVAMPAAAYEIEHHFCAQELAPDGTCPPKRLK